MGFESWRQINMHSSSAVPKCTIASFKTFRKPEHLVEIFMLVIGVPGAKDVQ